MSMLRSLAVASAISLLVVVLFGCVGRVIPAGPIPVPPTTKTDDSVKPKNIILFIADGAGYNTHLAYRYWKGEPLIYRGEGWSEFATATYNLRNNGGADGRLEQDPAIVYNAAKAYDDSLFDGEEPEQYPFYFEGYRWLRESAPDSAGTMSAIMTGQAVYKGGINIDGAGKPLLSHAEVAKRSGKSVGSISSVPFNHATPASGGGAHNISRNNYHELAREMFESEILDVLGGGGNPDFDRDGRHVGSDGYTLEGERFSYLPEDLWDQLTGQVDAEGPIAAWTLVQDRADVQAMADGETPGRVAMIPCVYDTLQFSRSSDGNPQADPVLADPRTDNVPTLAEMTAAALNVLDDNEGGYFLAVEGGAVDWAMHANATGRMIEEMQEFEDAIRLVVERLDDPDTPETWENTLVIVTADHDHMLFGPEADTDFFQDVTDNGAGKMPGYRWLSNGHSNQLVPAFVRGLGAEVILDRLETDGRLDPKHDAYIHQSVLGQAIRELIGSAK